MTSIAAVRKRPGMYVGNIDTGEGLHHLVWEVVANVVDLHLARQATELHVDVDGDVVTVTDDGPGMPVIDGKPALELLATTLRTTATWDGHRPHVHVGTSGCGLMPVTALSERLEIETTSDGVRWSQAFVRGVPVTELERRDASNDGTTVRFRPDSTIFGTLTLQHEAIRDRLQQLAWLNPYLRIYFGTQRVHGRGGLLGWLHSTVSPRVELALYQFANGITVDLALAWADGASVRSFVNMQETERGTHVDGIWRGFAEYARKAGASVTTAKAARAALAPVHAMIHVGLFGPEFANPVREDLRSPEAGLAVRQAIVNELPDIVQRDHELRGFLHERLGISDRS